MARNFNGTSDYIDVSNSPLLTSAPLTVAAWINWGGTTGTNDHWAVGRDDDVLGRAYTLGITDSTSQILAQIQGTPIQSGSTATANVWTHIAFTADASATSVITVYKNGVPGTPTARNLGASTGITAIGKRTYSGNNDWFNGSIADVGIWAAALSTTEVIALAFGARPFMIRPLALRGWWPLDGYIHPAFDFSFLHKSGVLSGSTNV